MLIPITIGYDGDNRVIRDLADINFTHLLVCLNKEQFDSVSKENILCINDNFVIYEQDYRDNDLRNNNESCSIILEQQLNDRYELLSKNNCRNIFEYNNHNNLKHIVILCFGYPKKGSISDKTLLHILQLGRAVGIHLICITDSIHKIPEITALNFVNRICTNNHHKEKVFISDEDYDLTENQLAFEEMWTDKLQIYKY